MVKNCSVLMGKSVPCAPVTPIDLGGSCRDTAEVGFSVSELYSVLPGISRQGKNEEENCLWNFHFIL